MINNICTIFFRLRTTSTAPGTASLPRNMTPKEQKQNTHSITNNTRYTRTDNCLVTSKLGMWNQMLLDSHNFSQMQNTTNFQTHLREI